jgi:enoyl-CoA hydratase/carnithine racemase
MSNIKLEKKDGIAILGINRPEALNALNRKIVDELDEAIEKIKRDKDVKVLVLYSKENFAAGADIKEMVDFDEEAAKKFAFSSTFNKIEDLEIPTIAAMEGYALGGGLELALTCDVRIASRNSKMGFPETGLGIMPGAGGTIRAPRLIGAAKAIELILFGTIINAEEALGIGLVNKVSEPEDLMNDVMKWAGKICQGAPVALKTAKATIKAGLKEREIKTAVSMEAENWAGLFRTEDQKEGMTAFIEKRKPIYKGK